MPRANTIRGFGLALCLALGACQQLETMREEYARLPEEVRTGAAAVAIGRVEPGVDRAEVLSALAPMVEGAPVCFGWPSLWLAPRERRSVYLARYDLMRRDWGEEVTSASEARMREFVELGLMTARPRDDLGAGAMEYTLTAEGDRTLKGSPYGEMAPEFCMDAQRRVVEITSLEWGQYECGSLLVRFTHAADAWPSWATTQQVQQRLGQLWGALGAPAQGVVTLGRQWFRPGREPDGVMNGALRSICLNAEREAMAGGDLDLSPPPAQ
jgi:hypothetical protein